MERWITRRTVFHGRIFDVLAGDALLDNGRLARREVVTHDGGIAIVPLLGDEVLLIRQFRIAAGRALLELPAGRREGQEEPLERAQQELIEEAGYRAGRMELLTTYYSSAGFSDERMHIFLATDLQHVGQALEPDEVVQIVPFKLTAVPALLASGELEDAKTIIGLYELLARQAGQGER